MKKLILMFTMIFSMVFGFAQEQESVEAEQDRTSMALDATAIQWSFQLAYQPMPDYHDDIVNGEPRPAGMDDYLQLRVVAPIPMKNITLLPRLTLHHYENSQGQSKMGNKELCSNIGAITYKNKDKSCEKPAD